MPSFSVIGVLRVLGSGLLNLLAAVVGTAILETLIHPVIRLLTSGSIGAIVAGLYITSVLIAGFLGVMAARYDQQVAVWIWVPPTLLLLLIAATLARTGSLWAAFTGSACADGLQNGACRMLFLVVIPTVRAVSYSMAAALAFRFLPIVSPEARVLDSTEREPDQTAAIRR